MKHLLLIFISFITISSAGAQAISEQYIPEIVKKKVAEMYPEAKGVYWKQPMPGFLDAYFTLNKRKCNATYQVSGAWVSTEFEVPVEEFPDSAKQYLAAHTTKVTRYYRSESKAKGVQYAADAKEGNSVMQFIFTKEGGYLMKGPRD
ncbi:MAG: hypothetical protein JST18_10295 [Bacteroidetes bacterium]|nr:hypothetical protein [Bacteroidota bacterium]